MERCTWEREKERGGSKMSHKCEYLGNSVLVDLLFEMMVKP